MRRLLNWIEEQNLEGKSLALLLLVVAALLASTLISQCAGPEPLPVALQGDIDAHERFRPRADAVIATLMEHAAASDARADSAIRVAKKLQANANAQGKRADSLAAVASTSLTAADSARRWHAAYDERTAQVASLTSVIVQDSVAISQEKQRGDSLQRALVFSDSLRLHGDTLLHRVVASIKSHGCTVPGTFDRVNCPSRTTAFWTGVGVATVTVVAITHRDDIRDAVRSVTPVRSDSRRGIALPILSVRTP
jgi:hypothetical protein